MVFINDPKDRIRQWGNLIRGWVPLSIYLSMGVASLIDKVVLCKPISYTLALR